MRDAHLCLTVLYFPSATLICCFLLAQTKTKILFGAPDKLTASVGFLKGRVENKSGAESENVNRSDLPRSHTNDDAARAYFHCK